MKRRAAGFTLVEILVTSVVVGAGLAIAAGALSTSLKAEVHAASSSRAARLLDLMLGRVEGGVLPIEAATGDFVADGEPDVTWAIVVNPTDQDRLSEVVITVTWTERGDPRSESVSRLFFQPPPPDDSSGSGASASSSSGSAGK